MRNAEKKEMSGKPLPKKSCGGAGVGVGICLAWFVVGLLVAILDPPIENVLHKRKIRRQFHEQFASPGHLDSITYEELAALFTPGFTIGDAAERFGFPRFHLHPYRSPTDIWRYPGILVVGPEAQEIRMEGLTLVFDNFVLQSWQPAWGAEVQVQSPTEAGMLKDVESE